MDSHLYIDAFLQPVHKKDEFRAFCPMVDRIPLIPETSDIYIADRGYCSYNNMAHAMEKGQHFLFRSKDVLSKGIPILPGSHPRFIEADISFDYVQYGSDDTYTMTFRAVRMQLPSGMYECLVTNLSPTQFPPERLAGLYFSRWKIECAYRDLKYTIGMTSFHSCKAMHVEQEVYARLLLYNITEALVQSTVPEAGNTKYAYQVNFTRTAHICRAFLRLSPEEGRMNIAALLRKELIPLRKDRKYPRLQAAIHSPMKRESLFL